MKAYKLLLLIALTAGIAACSKEDATKDYGFAKVYIPQATVTGIDNSYPIPLGPFSHSPGAVRPELKVHLLL